MRNYTLSLCRLLMISAAVTACRDDAPPTVTVDAFSKTIAENPTKDQSLGTVVATTNRGRLTYGLTNQQDPAGALAINSSNGELRVANPAFFDYETHPVITAVVTVSGGSTTQIAPITITLSDVEPELTSYQREVVAYFKEIALGFEFGNVSAITRKWRSPMRVFVGGQKNDALYSELATVVNEINALVTDGFSIEMTGDSLRSNFYVFLGPGASYARLYPSQAALVDDNWGLFSVFWNGQNEINRGHMYVDSERPNPEAQKHLLREELTQSLGLARDASIYPLSIFLSDWSTTTAYADVDQELIRLLYHPKMRIGLDEDEVEALLEDIFLSE